MTPPDPTDSTPDLPDVRAVGVTYDATDDLLHVDVGEYVGDFEALGMLMAATFRQLAVCIDSSADPDELDDL